MDSCTDESLGHFITLYEMGALGDPDRDRFEEHVLDCAFCRRELTVMNPAFEALLTQREPLLKELHDQALSFESRRRAFERQLHQQRETSIWRQNSLDKLWNLLKDLGSSRELAPALSLTGLVLILLFSLPFPQVRNPYLSFLSFHKVAYSSLTERGEANPEARRFFEAGILLYQQEDYAGAAVYLKKATDKSPAEASYWFYLGLCFYLAHQPAPAIEALSRAAALFEPAQQNRANWYLSQAYLLQGQVDPALTLLEALARQGLEYSSEAGALLQTLRNAQRSHF